MMRPWPAGTDGDVREPMPVSLARSAAGDAPAVAFETAGAVDGPQAAPSPDDGFAALRQLVGKAVGAVETARAIGKPGATLCLDPQKALLG